MSRDRSTRSARRTQAGNVGVLAARAGVRDVEVDGREAPIRAATVRERSQDS
jgi:hypothetical protein